MSSGYVCCNCGSHRVTVFYRVKKVPVHSCLLMSSPQQALEFPCGEIALGFCKECSFIFNVTFDSSKQDYSEIYEDQQCFSPTFNAFAQRLAGSLVEKYNLRGKNILEIGCGKGDFLALLCELGHNYGVGIDPAYSEGRIKGDVSNHLTFIRDYYSERYANYCGDLVCCRHTLEHIQDTKGFVKNVRAAIGDCLETVVFFEVPDVTRVLRELAFWDVYYEHCSYFGPASLARLFRSCKFEVTCLSRDFDDQYLLIEAKPVTEISTRTHGLEEDIAETARQVKHFAEYIQKKLDEWKDLLRQIRMDGKRAVIWGSGSKCVAFMATLNVSEEIEYVIDVNPHRHGKFIAGTGKKIMPPAFLKKYRPDVTIVMNEIYCNEIRQMLADMKVTTELISI